MTSSSSKTLGFTIQETDFEAEKISKLARTSDRLQNWPVVYILSSPKAVYVGETQNYEQRMRQHLHTPDKKQLSLTHVVLDERFNKSACLDLESTLINLFTGDGQKQILNANNGIVDADYFRREEYRVVFNEIFERLHLTFGLFSKSRPEIENSDFFKYSPFKELNPEQEKIITTISETLFNRISENREDLQKIYIQGGAGTGKTILAVYLMKLFADFGTGALEEHDPSTLSDDDLSTPKHRSSRPLEIGLVIPQQSLRDTLKKVFKCIKGLKASMVMSPFDIPKVVTKRKTKFDLLIVDEAHRLNRFAAQATGFALKGYRNYNEALFGPGEGDRHNQLDWVNACAKNAILLLDPTQAIRPADLSSSTWKKELDEASKAKRVFSLTSQMRMKISEIDRYKRFLDKLFGDGPLTDSDVPDFGEYDFRIFTDFDEMRKALREKELKVGLSRTLAGYGWEWKSNPSNKENAGLTPDALPFDMQFGHGQYRWNQTTVSWVHSDNAFNEIGSIHTIQGYDLNYAAVIIGPEVELDGDGKYRVNRSKYFDDRGKQHNTVAGETTTPERLNRYVANIYKVLLTRGIRGTYIYAGASGLVDRFMQVQEILENRALSASDN